MKHSGKTKPVLLGLVVCGLLLGVAAKGQQAARKMATAASAEAATGSQTSDSGDTNARDFEVFKTKVEPIFLKKRPGHARCYGCHILPNRGFHLEPLSPGSAAWNDDQSRRNFQHVLQHVAPGDPTSSRLLLHPLAPEAGGDPFHSGGRQFASQNDPDWLVLAEWIGSGRTDTRPLSKYALIYVTNSAVDTVDVINSATNTVLHVIHGIELPR